MVHINLEKLISKKDLSNIITGLANIFKTPIEIQNKDGQVIACFNNTSNTTTLSHSELNSSTNTYPITLNNITIGWIKGDHTAHVFSELLAYLANKEYEKKSLVVDMLDKYREINLLYGIADKIVACTEVKDIACLIIDEARQLIHAQNASIMLLNNDTTLEILSAYGNEFFPKTLLRRGEGIAGNVALTGIAEIVNDAVSDPRFVNGHNIISSLLCAPLKLKDRILGVINLSSHPSYAYSAEDLKLLNILASQAASFIDNAILYENKIKTENIKTHLQRYVSPQIVSSILEDTKGNSLNPSRRKISILFSDIRNFSSVCERLAPEEIVKYLNEYFSHMVEIIFEHKGTVNKFVGDMIVAFFGAPFHCDNLETQAIKSAIEMQKCIKKISNGWIRDNFTTGIGITAGEVVVGNIGSPQHMDYTAIGDEVNIADRLQSLAKGGQILVEQNIYHATKDIFKYEQFGKIMVKGKEKPIEIFNVIY
ncbi:MAG: GAF domain-containing protein [Candidatus Kuenenia sp.]|nr:GAF domain-containing protein [Candidatus Kuenenia hertensis]